MRRFFSGLALPAWLLFVWGLMSELSTGQTAWSVLYSAYAYLDRHPFWVMVIGVGWLALVVEWPNIQPRLPAWLRLPKTTGERLRDLDTQIETLTNLHRETAQHQSRIHDLLSDIDRLSSERMLALEQWRNEQIIRLAEIERNASTAISRLDEQREWIADLERELRASSRPKD